MTISIEPARIVGAEVGDRVSYESPIDAPPTTWYGRIAGLSTEFPGRVVIDLEDTNGGCRHIAPERLTLAPKKYAVGDEVTLKDEDFLPDGTTLTDVDKLPLFKTHGKWYLIDPGIPAPGTRETRLFGTRTIAWMPAAYTNS